MNDKSKELNAFFNETYSRFAEITEYAILLEKIGGGKVQVNVINELRSVLFHLYGFLDNPDASNPDPASKGHVDALEHLNRAYYDIFSLISAFLIKAIREYSTTYSLKVIHQVYPEYFTRIIPEINAISKRIAEIRSGRKTTKQQGVTNSDTITVMLDWHSELVSRTNVLIEFQDLEDDEKHKSKKKDRIDLLLKIFLPIGGVILGVILNHIYNR